MNKGLVHIYTGEGKGKTTAALGLALRSAGYNNSVGIYQFLKATETGELVACKNLDIIVERCAVCEKFWFEMTDEEKAKTVAKVELALNSVYDREYSLLILDEVICVADLGIITYDRLIEIIKNKPEETELVLTGRGNIAPLLPHCDYVSEIKCVKHPFDKNIVARKGVEF